MSPRQSTRYYLSQIAQGPGTGLVWRIASGLVWLIAAAVLVSLLWARYGRSEAADALVLDDRRQVAPVSEARLLSLAVTAGETVTAGQELARLADATLELEQQAVQDRLRRLEEEWSTRQALLQARASDTRRDRQLDAAQLQERRARIEESARDAGRDLLQARRDLEATRGELAIVASELERLGGLLQRGMVTENDLVELRQRRTVLQAEADALPGIVDHLQTTIAQTDRRLATLNQLPGDADQDPTERLLDLEFALEEQLYHSRRRELRHQADLLAIRSEQLVLRSPVSGLVLTVLTEPGDVCDPQTPVCSIVPDGPHRVVTWVDAVTARTLAPGDPITVVPHATESERLTGEIVSVARSLEAVDPALVRHLRGMQRGVPVTARVDRADLRIGERVRLYWARR